MRKYLVISITRVTFVETKRKTMIEQKPTTKEKIALRLIMFAVRILLGYSMNDDLKSIYTKINTDLEN